MGGTVRLVDALHQRRFGEKQSADAIVALFDGLEEFLVHLDDFDKVAHQLGVFVAVETGK